MATEISAVDYLTRSVDRNRYFYGKLMTVRDFLREQEYFNSKRWLINRLLFGSGIVCGLEVRSGGDAAATVVQIEPGVAFDQSGREITVVNRERVDLATLVKPDHKPGGAGTGETQLLVCLNYHECPKEPVPSLGGSPCDEVCESNRIGETYTVGLLKARPDPDPPTPCENWLNRQTVRRSSADFEVEHVAPVWVRQEEVFEVAVKVTARKDVADVTLTETVTGGSLVEPNPLPPTQFPTPPLSLRKGEFFVYVYQVQASAVPGKVQISGGAGVPVPPTSVDVLDAAKVAERGAEMRLGICVDQPAQEDCVPIARVRAVFNAGNLTRVEVLDDFGQQRFRYNLTRVAELLDCVRASLQAAAESPRPGHVFITFKDLERTDLQPIGPAADHGRAFTVPRGDHVHALLLQDKSGLEFQGNRLRVEGDVGGERINFLKPVSGQMPVSPQHLVTKGYVDSRIAGLDWQESVISRKLVLPPEEPREGDRYLLVADEGTKLSRKSVWAKHVGSIATWNGSSWVYTEPDEGTAVFVDDENIAYLFVEGKWIPFLATPDVAAGLGLRANGAVLSVGQGPGLQVNENDVEVVFEANMPPPVGPKPDPGASPTAARGDHTHALPLAPKSGLAFGRAGLPGPDLPAKGMDRIDLRGGLHINGPVGGSNIDFLHPVWGQSPTEPRHFATKQYVDGIAAGLDWQSSVLDKDLFEPPPEPDAGARYLILWTSKWFPIYIRGPVGVRPDVGLAPGPLPDEGPGGPVPVPDEEPKPLPVPDEEPKPLPIPDEEPRPTPLPKNVWQGHEGSIATWDGRVWVYTPPNEGMAVFVEDENTTYLFVEGNWVPFLAMPEVAAGLGLRADGAILSVGPGPGLRVGENEVEVIYAPHNPAAVGPSTFPGFSNTAARGDHAHELPLAPSGGLEFVRAFGDVTGEIEESGVEGGTLKVGLSLRLRVNGPVGGDRIDFLRPVSGQEPVDPRHLTTKQYVDGVVAGLTWQSTVLDKDLTGPPEAPPRGARYLLFVPPARGTAWEGREGHIATWGGKRWDFTAPTEGMAAFVADENLAYLFADGKWMQFLAPPPAVGAGDGLVRAGGDLAVGRGEGLVVSADAVSVNFGMTEPSPVGTAPSTGSSLQAAQSDHTHELPLADQSGLEFFRPFRRPPREERSVVIEPDPGFLLPPGLRVNGPVGGDSIDFQFPVKGQPPFDPRHLATKQYVDEKSVGVVAGGGLVSKENVISVGAGPGLVVDPEEVLLNFENGAPQPVATSSHPGLSNTVARGDHVHAMPDTWVPNTSTGVVSFNLKDSGQMRFVIGPAVDPRLGTGAITVVLGLESLTQGEGIFVGPVEEFEDAMVGSGGFRMFPPVILGATVFPAGDGVGLKSSTFQIWAHATLKDEFLPDAFRVRWWAYRGGRDFGESVFSPVQPR